MKALTTLEALKSYLQIPDTNTSHDQFLNQLIEGVSWAVRRRTNREFNSAERTEFHNGNGTEFIHLKHRPVTAVAGVWLDASGFYGQAAGSFADPETLLEPGRDFYVENLEANERNPSRLVMITNPWAFGVLNQVSPIGETVHALWPRGRGNIKVTYTAGYREMPDDLEMAIHALCADARSNAPKGGQLKSETLGRYTYERMTGADLKGTSADCVSARSIIASYAECEL